jgi:hypothetical protein
MMDRWRRIEALFDEAVKQPPSDRDAYLRRACAQDLELYHEVTSLLSHDADGTNDESWAARAAGALLEERSRSPQSTSSHSSLAAGMSLGPSGSPASWVPVQWEKSTAPAIRT